MKKIKLLLGIIYCLTIFGCTENKNSITDNEFVLKGLLDGIENNSWIYLILDNQKIDSTQVIDNKFTFKGKIEHPKQYNLLVKNSRNYTRIWLESGEIDFKATNGAFKEAFVKGSKSQIESEKLWKPIWKYRKRRDSLSKIISDEKINDSIKNNASLALKKVEKNRLKIERNFIRNNPNSYVSAETLDFYSTSLQKKPSLNYIMVLEIK